MRISDWSSDVCSSVLIVSRQCTFRAPQRTSEGGGAFAGGIGLYADVGDDAPYLAVDLLIQIPQLLLRALKIGMPRTVALRSEEHTSELQSLMRLSYAVFYLQKQTTNSHICTTKKPLNT